MTIHQTLILQERDLEKRNHVQLYAKQLERNT